MGVLALAATIGGCTPQVEFNPFKVDSREVRERVQTIALAPLVAASSLANRDAAQAQLEPLATARLQAGGYAVVSSDAMQRLWQRAAEDVGGVYDPITGEADSTRFDAVEAAVFRELRSEHDVDAVLFLSIAPVTFYLPGQRITYCGTTSSEPVYWPPSIVAMNETVMLAVVLCLNTALFDLEGRQLYAIRYGLEPIETYAAQTRAVRPLAQRLLHPSRLREAINENLGPLANAGNEPLPEPNPAGASDDVRRSLGRPPKADTP